MGPHGWQEVVIALHDGAFGRVRLAETLAGEPPRVPSLALDADPARGAFEHTGTHGYLALLAQLETDGLTHTTWKDGRYPVIELTRDGRLALGLPVPPRNLTRIGFDRPGDQALFDELVSRRNELAETNGLLPSELARLVCLRDAVLKRPGTLEEVAPLLPAASHASLGPVVLEVLVRPVGRGG